MATSAKRNPSSVSSRRVAGKSRESKTRNNQERDTKIHLPALGPRLRHARMLMGLSLREVADRVGISESFVSKIENSRVRPSLATLHRLVTVLQTNIGVLFVDPQEDIENVMLTRKGKRPIIRVWGSGEAQGIELERLIPARSENLLQANVHVVPPGEGTDELISHSGQEFGFVLEGQVELIVSGQKIELSQGDTFVFESSRPHGYRNRGRLVARIIWVNTPPTF